MYFGYFAMTLTKGTFEKIIDAQKSGTKNVDVAIVDSCYENNPVAVEYINEWNSAARDNLDMKLRFLKINFEALSEVTKLDMVLDMVG
jgi:hypothetical protein